MLSTKQVRLTSALRTSLEKQKTMTKCCSVPTPTFPTSSHIRTAIPPAPLVLFLVFLQTRCNCISSGEMVLMIFLTNICVQIVGAACGSAPAEANVWSVTDFSR